MVALKIDPNILKKIKISGKVLAVTGSNGKTSTVEMIAHILRKNGKIVAFNKEGSNQIQGITTFILENCNFLGKTKSDFFLLEIDERFSKHIFEFIKPTYFVILNLFRDQLTRNVNPEAVFRSINEAFSYEIILVLNANDPLTACFSSIHKNKVIWFGFQNFASHANDLNNVYDDGKFCPNCKAKLLYKTRFFNHIGIFECENCMLKTPDKIDFCGDSLINNKNVSSFFPEFAAESFFYNLLAAFSSASLLGIDSEKILQSLKNFKTKTMRILKISIQKKSWVLLISKHENSVSYDQSIKVLTDYKEPCSVFIIIDSISRKYFTNDISWLYDIDFYKLKSEHIKKIALSGKYANDLAACLLIMGIPFEKVFVHKNILHSINFLNNNAEEQIFVMTCFADKEKFLKNLLMLKN